VFSFSRADNCSKGNDGNNLWQATEDDILPLSTPLRTSSGSLINNIHISKGTSVTIPIMCVNRSVVFWGEESKVFRPERWLDAGGGQRNDGRWQEISGHRHLLTFADGPRACLGKGFALAEIKVYIVLLWCVLF
jgi:cytochrome P450